MLFILESISWKHLESRQYAFLHGYDDNHNKVKMSQSFACI